MFNLCVTLAPREYSDILDTKSINFSSDYQLLENLTTRLLSFNQNGEWICELASSIEQVEDLKFEFQIRKTYFSNGEQIELEDVRNTILRNCKFGSGHSTLKDIVHDLYIKDQKLIVLINHSPKAFLYNLSMADLGILHRSQSSKNSLFAEDFNRVSSGPFYYKKEDGDFLLMKNRGYKLSSIMYPETVKLINPFDKKVLSFFTDGKLDIVKFNYNDYFDIKTRIPLSFKLVSKTTDTLTYIYFNKNAIKKFPHEFKAGLRDTIEKKFDIGTEFSTMARRAIQYFPSESRAYVEPDDLREMSKSTLDFKVSTGNLTIRTFTTAYDVTIKGLVKQLENLPNFEIEINDDVKTSDFLRLINNGEIDAFIGIMGSDYNSPLEALNFEYFSIDSKIDDPSGNIRRLYNKFNNSLDGLEEDKLLKEITIQIYNDSEIIPLFHSAIPLFYNKDKILAQNEMQIFHFWRLTSN